MWLLLQQLFMEPVWHQLQKWSTTHCIRVDCAKLNGSSSPKTHTWYMSIRFPNICLHERNGTFMQYLSDRRWTLSAYVDVPLATAQQGAAEELRRCSCTWALWNASGCKWSSIGKQDFNYSLIDKKKTFGPHDFGRNDQAVSGSGVGVVCTIGIGWDQTSCNLEIFGGVSLTSHPSISFI